MTPDDVRDLANLTAPPVVGETYSTTQRAHLFKTAVDLALEHPAAEGMVRDQLGEAIYQARLMGEKGLVAIAEIVAGGRRVKRRHEVMAGRLLGVGR